MKTIEKELKTILENNSKEINALHEELSDLEQKDKTLQDTIIAAKQNDDMKAYKKAVTEQREAVDIKHFHIDKIDRLKTDPLIDDERYNELTQKIKGQLQLESDKAVNRVNELLNELKDIGDNLSEKINYGNELLSTLQHDIYKDDASIKTASGRMRVSSKENRHKDYSIVQSINAITANAATNIFYKENN